MIDFESQGVDMPLLDKRKIVRWLRSVAADYGFSIGCLHYIFCDDKRILEVNRAFLQHDYYTDVITFDYTVGQIVSGDIFISLETVKSNAEMVEDSYERELLRILAHGLLHLTGQADKTPESKIVMTQKEEAALAKVDFLPFVS